jgi:hypothetical protein
MDRGNVRLACRLGQPFPHRHENQPIVPPETFRATDWLEKKYRKKVAFGKRAASRTETSAAAAVAAVKFKESLGPQLVEEVFRHNAPRKTKL